MTRQYRAGTLRPTAPLRAPDVAAVNRVIQDALGAAGLMGTPGTGPAIGPNLTHARGMTAEAGRAGVNPGAPDLGLPFGRPDGLARGFAGLPGLGRAAMPADLAIPAGALFLDAQYSCEAGGRRYRLYIPSTAGDGLRGMIVMLHGCTQTPEDFAAGTGMNDLAERHGLLVLYPAQTGCDNSMSCWNWFRPSDQRRGAGEPSIIAGLTVSLRDRYSIPHDRVFVAGLSAGGAMAAILGEAYPDIFSAVGVHSAPAHHSAVDVVSALAAMRGQPGGVRRAAGGAQAVQPGPRVIVFHGLGDTTVHPVNAEQVVSGLGGSRGRTSRSEHPASGEGRAYTRLIVADDDGTHRVECWMIEGAPHAWAGGRRGGSYTDPSGPDASAAMVAFFLSGASDAASG